MRSKSTTTPGTGIGFDVPESTKGAWASWHATGSVAGHGSWKKIYKQDDPRNTPTKNVKVGRKK